MVYPIARYTLLPFIRFFIKKTVGLENAPLQGPYIIACKHLASLDGAFIASVLVPHLNQKIYYVANVARWGLVWEKIVSEQWAGCIPFYKENPGVCIQIADDYIKKGRIVGIFPEGMIELKKKGKSHPKTGTARLALWNKVPILPIGLKHDITIADKNNMHRRRNTIKNILQNPHSLEIHIGKPFELSEYYDKPIDKVLLDEAMSKVMNQIDNVVSINPTTVNSHI